MYKQQNFGLMQSLLCTGRPWIQVKSNIKREYPKVQYTAWTVCQISPRSSTTKLIFPVLYWILTVFIIQNYAVLARRGLDQSPVCATSVSSNLSQHCGMLLVCYIFIYLLLILICSISFRTQWTHSVNDISFLVLDL